MTERTWERFGAATGIAFGLLLLVAIFMAPQPPHIDATAQKIAAYYADHRRVVLASGVVGAFATIAVVLFIAHLRHVYDRVEHGVEGLSTVVYATGLAAVAASLFFGVTSSVLAFMAAQPGGLTDAGVVRALYDVGWVGNGMTLVLTAAFLTANAVAMVRGEAASPLLGWLAAVAAACSLVGGIGLLTVSSYSTGWAAMALIGILAFAAWSIVAGGVMLRRPEAETVASHRSLIAPSH